MRFNACHSTSELNTKMQKENSLDVVKETWNRDKTKVVFNDCKDEKDTRIWSSNFKKNTENFSLPGKKKRIL